jgi:hypothetical protein
MMTNSESSKKLDNPQEIISHLTQAVIREKSAFIWNRNFEGKIAVNEQVKLLKITHENQICVEFLNAQNLDAGEEVFFALEGGALVFKSTVINCQGKKTLLSLPCMATGVERRRSPRKQFKFEDRIIFELEFYWNLNKQGLVAYLLDISEHGLCLTFSDETVKKLELNKPLTILRGKDVSSRTCVVRSIRIFRPANMGRSALYAVGLEFQ